MNTGDLESGPESQEADYQLSLRPQINNNPEWDSGSPSKLRDVSLTFEYWETKQVYEVRATGPIFNNEYWAGQLLKPRANLVAAIDQCLDTWQQKVAYRQDAAKGKLFQNRLDFNVPGDKGLLDLVWLDIARAGRTWPRLSSGAEMRVSTRFGSDCSKLSPPLVTSPGPCSLQFTLTTFLPPGGCSTRYPTVDRLCTARTQRARSKDSGATSISWSIKQSVIQIL